MTTTQTDALMALADRYAFHIPGSQHSDEARAVLLAALQAREGEAVAWSDDALNRVYSDGVAYGERNYRQAIATYQAEASGYKDAYFKLVESIANLKVFEPAPPIIIAAPQHSDEARAALLAALQEQAREVEAVANSAILARGRFHAFKGENGEPDDWEWFEEGTNCAHGCIDAVIVRADAISAPQPAQPSEPAQPEQGHST